MALGVRYFAGGLPIMYESSLCDHLIRERGEYTLGVQGGRHWVYRMTRHYKENPACRAVASGVHQRLGTKFVKEG